MWRGGTCGSCIKKQADTPTRKGRYAEYRNTDEWRERRDAVMARDSSLCRLKFRKVCTNHATVVHHVNYDRIGDEALTDMVATCEGCHEKWHQMEKEDRGAWGTP